jgi:hypothetical protein
LAGGVALQAASVIPAFANAANPDPDTKGTFVVNADSTVTANLSGTWTWVGQKCEGRYAEGWAVDWWGISNSKTPNPNFSLTNASAVTAVGTTTTTTISPAGAIPIKGGGFFHVAKYYGGETINSASTCTNFGSGKTAGSTGSWSATATYPSQSDVPPQVCVNIYDEHGKEGQPSKSANDLSPINDHDNSIQTNAFDPSAGAGYCVGLQPAQTIQGEIYLCSSNNTPTTTLVSGGSISVPSANLSSGNPLAPTSVSAGTYTMNASTPAHYVFVPCGQTAVTLGAGHITASQSVTVPPGGAGDGRFYAVLGS